MSVLIRGLIGGFVGGAVGYGIKKLFDDKETSEPSFNKEETSDTEVVLDEEDLEEDSEKSNEVTETVTAVEIHDYNGEIINSPIP